MNRERTPLLNVADLLAGFAFSSEFYTSDAVGPRLMLGANIAPGSPNWEKKVHWPTHLLNGLEKYRLAEGDVVLAMDRPWIPAGLKMFRLPRADEGCLLVQRVARLRGSARLDTGYLYYALRAQDFTDYILGVQTGSTVPHISSGQILGYPIHLPPLHEQRRIAAILGALDDKIDLNRRMNRTLEEMAQSIFKSWFIDFDGHTDLVDSELGPIPSGWDVSEIGSAVRVVGGSTPSTGNPVFWEGGRHHWTTPKDLSAATCPLLLTTERLITDAGVASISSGLLPAGTFLLSSRAPIGYTAIARMPVAINQGYIAIPPGGRLNSLFLLHWTRANLDVIKARSGGTTFQEISKSNFRPILVAVPPSIALRRFDSAVGPLFDRIEVNERQTQTLADLRDTLLPKLISGEIRVPEAEHAVMEAT